MPQPSTRSSERVFASTWSEMERRHPWRVTEVEVNNPDFAVSKLPFAWQDFSNQHAAKFREHYRLAELLADAPDEWTAILRLRHWVFTHLRNGVPTFEPRDPLSTIEASLSGAPFWCAHFAYMFAATASSMGFSARHLGIDSDHTESENSTHHGVADIWVNQFRKWVIIDANYDAHYELNGVPLNAEELCKRWQTHRGAGVQARVGLDSRPVARANGEIKQGEPEACGYFWNFIDCCNNPFQRRGLSWPRPAVFIQDEARSKRIWYQGSAQKPYKHGGYDGFFIPTSRVEDGYPDLNCVKLVAQPPSKMPYYCPIRIDVSMTPNFSHVVIRENGGAPIRFEGVEYPWRLLPGACSLEVRAVNDSGHQGPPSTIAVNIEEVPGRAGEWPNPPKK